MPLAVPSIEPDARPSAPDRDFARPGRARRPSLRWPDVETLPPWHVRLGNWWRNRTALREMRRAPSNNLRDLGARLREASPLVLWPQDGVLALRSADVNHLPAPVARP